MKNPAINPKRFFFAALVILIVSVFLYMSLHMRDFISLSAYPYDEIFYEDSITASTDAEDFAKRFSSNTGKQEVSLVPVGITVGVRFYTEGIMVLGTDAVPIEGGAQASPSDGKLLPGDVVMKIDGDTMFNLSQMINAIGSSGDSIILEVQRDGITQNIEISPVKDAADHVRKIGCWVRDSTQGIGTITYYDPVTGQFGALGHGIMDVDTKKLMTVRHGQIVESHIVDVRKGKKGAPGELIGEIHPETVIGTIDKNTPRGIYGSINTAYPELPTNALVAARHDQITQGPAKIFSNIEGGEIKSYDVYIESVNKDATADKGLVVRITDQGLITRTNGIVQGMSGSPIVQDGKIIGAVTHVTVQCYNHCPTLAS